MRAEQASLSLLTVSPANRIAMHKHPGAEVLYVLKGHARVLGPQGRAPEKIDEGEAIFIPGDFPHAIENMGRSAPAVMLEIFVPLGPEKVYRDPKDEAGRAAFEVIRDPREGDRPRGREVRRGQRGRQGRDASSVAGGQRARPPAVRPKTRRAARASTSAWSRSSRGGEIPRHTHEGSRGDPLRRCRAAAS